MSVRWTGVPGTTIEVSDDGQQFRWNVDRDGAEFLMTELHGDGTGKEWWRALEAADQILRRREDDDEWKPGIRIGLVPR